MKSIIALFVAAVIAQDDVVADAEVEAEAEVEEVATNWMGMAIPNEGAPSVMFAAVGGFWTFTGTGQAKNSWFAISWNGAAESSQDKADFVWIKTNDNENIEVKDMWSEAAGTWADAKPVDDGSNSQWTGVGTGGDTISWVVTYAPSDAADAKDVVIPCGTAAEGEVEAVNFAWGFEWFSNPTSNDFNNVWTAEGDYYAETDAACSVVWWSNGERPVVVAGAQALAAAASVAVAALYM